MTTVAVLADPPVPGAVLPAFVDDGPLDPAQAADLAAAMLADVCEAVRKSGGELIVNYRPADQLPAAVEDPKRRLQELLAEELPDADEIRHEVQVGSTLHARAGNTISHLLETEGVRTAAVVTPTVPFLSRQHLDSAAMKLRRSDVVLGPGSGGRIYYAGFGDPIDFTDAFEPPAIRTLARTSTDEGMAVDFLPTLPVLERPADLETVLPLLAARRAADKPVPARTSRSLESLFPERFESI